LTEEIGRKRWIGRKADLEQAPLSSLKDLLFDLAQPLRYGGIGGVQLTDALDEGGQRRHEHALSRSHDPVAAELTVAVQLRHQLHRST
jgi:hypothetical protein